MPIQFIVRRLLSLMPVLFIVSIAIFSLTYLLPGDPAVQLAGGDNATPERIMEIRQQLGLDRTLVAQYWSWISGIVTGDMGQSLYNGEPVSEQLIRRFPVTLSLAFGAMTVAIIVGMMAGTIAALRRNSWVDHSVQIFASIGISAPSFWVAMTLVVTFSVTLGWLPAVGYIPLSESPSGWLKSILIPSVALGFTGAAVIARQLRGSLIDTLEADFIRTARARGLSQRRLVVKHALKNAMVPVLTVLGVQAAYLLGGSIVIEQVMGIPGVGKYIFECLFSLDLPGIQASVLAIAVVVVFVNLLVDISYGIVNPKIRQE